MKKKGSFIKRHSRLFKTISIMMILAISALIFLLYRGYETFKWGMSESIIWQASSLSERFLISKAEQKKIDKLIDPFVKKIRTGNIPVLKGFTVLNAFYKGPVFMALLNSSITNQQETFENPPKIGSESCNLTSTLFFNRVMQDKIAPDTFERVKKLLIEKKYYETNTVDGYRIPEKIESFKKNISSESFFKCLSLMKEANGDTTLTDITKTLLIPSDELKKIISKLQATVAIY